MMKMAGALLITGTTSLWGIKEASKVKNQLKHMKCLQKIICLIQSEIRYSKAYLGEIFWKIGQSAEEPYKSWLLEMSKKANTFSGESFEDIWKGSVEKNLKILELPVCELEALKSLGNQLGYADVQIQVKLLDIYLEHLEYTISEVQEEIKGKTRLYHCLGVMSGLLISIVLF